MKFYANLKYEHLEGEAKLPEKDEFFDKFPWRSPAETASAVRHLIEGKTVCDVGCAKGDMVLQFGKYAKRSFGINCHEKEVRIGKLRGAEVVKGNALLMKIPRADCYFLYKDGDLGGDFIARALQEVPGPFTVFSGGYEGQVWQWDIIKRFHAKKVYVFKYLEHETINEDWAPAEGYWWLVEIRKEAPAKPTRPTNQAKKVKKLGGQAL